MVPELLTLLPAPVTFVVGKGGVGKSTAAAALALRLADAGQPTHLISTDPAHSVGDLFDTRLDDGEVKPSPCTPALTLEELDARGRAQAWMARVAEPVLELLDLGTYLAREDVHSFVELALPGVDEFMAALRLAELAQNAERIVVDTAPTGHTLRLVDSGRLLEGWVEALEAMAEKAGAVQERLMRRRVGFQGEEVLADLQRQVARFEERVLKEADVVLVSRADPVVTAETERLLDQLRARKLRIAVELRVGGGGPPLSFPSGSEPVPLAEVPWAEELRGCEGLHRWGEGGTLRGARGEEAPPALSPTTASDPERRSDAGTGMAPASSVLARELLFFAGKGGVGKSTCASACALALSRESSVLLLGTDPAGSLGDVLGVEVDEIQEATLREGRLRVRQVNAEREFEAFRDRYRERIREVFQRLGLDRSAHLDRRVLESLLGLAPPGIDEIFALNAILEERGRAGTLVVDAAPTGHFLRLVEMPEVAMGWTREVLRLLLKYRSVLSLGDFAEEPLQFARSLRSLLERLRDPERTGVVVVTLDSPVVRSETQRLREALERAGVPLAAALWNRYVREASPAGAGNGREKVGRGESVIRAPLLSPSPVGPEALLDFFSRWEFVH